MMDSLFIAATGLQAEQQHLDTISNNLSNLNTPAFKKSRVSFDDLVFRNSPSAQGSAGSVGMGSAVANVNKVFSPGDLRATESAFDLAIRGNGFFEVELENGELGYTRNGALQLDEMGYLTTGDGMRLSSRVQLPPDVSEFRVSRDGEVQVRIGSNVEFDAIGNLDLANFVNMSALESVGNGLYIASPASGSALYSAPGENGLGFIEQGFLEASNVDLVGELVELTVAQRAFEVNSQMIRASDDMMEIVNNLRQ